VVTQTSVSDSNSPKAASAACPAGKVAIAGGARVIAAAAAVPQVALQESTQFSTDVWRATASEAAATANSWAVEVRALCVTVAP
jgi:hypothetical protein